MAPLGGSKIFCLLVVLLAILQEVNSGCGWYRGSSKDSEEDRDRDRDRYRHKSKEVEEDEDDGGWRKISKGRQVGGSYGDIDEDDDDDDFDESEEYDDYEKDGRYHDRRENDDSREEKIKPTERCHKKGGYCMRLQDKCRGEIRLFQTNCIDECECCMDGKQISGQNIEIVKSRRDWHGARDECRDLGGDLLVPKSVGDLLYLLKKNDMSTHKVWIGISDNRQPGRFRGIQGNRIKNGWQNREPRRHEKGEDCVVIQHRTDTKRGMRVRRCREEHYFICDLGSDYRSDHTVRYQM